MSMSLSFEEMALRIGLAFIAGMVVGFERESHGRAAGLRTTVLVCVAAATAMIISEELMHAYPVNGGWRPDPARLGAGILTGMGFLGAGSIIRHENLIRGVTTAATIWCITVVGLALGAGCYPVALLGWVAALTTLFILPRLEALIKNDWYATVTITTSIDGPSEEALRKLLAGLGVKVKGVDLEYDLENKKRTVCYDLKFKKSKQSSLVEISHNVVHQLIQQPQVTNVKWK